MLAFFGTATFGGFETFDPMTQFLIQLRCVGVTAAWSGVATVLIAMLIKVLGGLRVSAEDEETGLDESAHGEKAYHV